MYQHCVDAYNHHRFMFYACKKNANYLLNKLAEGSFRDQYVEVCKREILKHSEEATHHYIDLIPLRNYRDEALTYYAGWYEKD